MSKKSNPLGVIILLIIAFAIFSAEDSDDSSSGCGPADRDLYCIQQAVQQGLNNAGY